MISVFFAAVLSLLSFTTVYSVCVPQVPASNLSACPINQSISIEYYVNPELWYFRPAEIGLSNFSLSAVPEYFALSAGAVAMTKTLNQLFQGFQTVHYGGPSLFNISVPVTLNMDGNSCLSSVIISIIPQYDLRVVDIGVGNSYYARGLQGQINNRESCEVCNANSNPFAVIHGELTNAALYDVTSQVCNAFNVPVIAASITDLTFQQLYPASQLAAPWSALSSTSPAQISSAFKGFLGQFNWNFIVVFLDPNDQDQANEMSEITFGLSFVVYQNIDSTGTGCQLAILGAIESGFSVIYLDMVINKCAQCVNQILTSGLMEQNYIVIWGPTLMASVNNNLQTLASASNLSLSAFTGTFTLQTRMSAASFLPSFFSNMNGVFESWNASFLAEYENLDIVSVYDHANAVILASQGVASLFADQLCFFGNEGLMSNLSAHNLNNSLLVSEVTTKFVSFLSNSQLDGTYNIQSESSTGSDWKVELPVDELNLVPSRAFQYYTQQSGIWSEATNIAQWVHDSQGNSIVTIDVYNVVPEPMSANNLVGSYMSGNWMPNPITIVWPNNESLWQYVSGYPSNLAPLSSLSLSCITNSSCSSELTVAGTLHNGALTSYSTEASLSESGEWSMQIKCSEAGSVPSFGAALDNTSPAWSLIVNNYGGEVQVNFDSQFLGPDNFGINVATLSFWCTNSFSVLNSSVLITVNINPTNYNPSVSAQWGAGTANVVGIVVSTVGACLTLIFRHKKAIYSSSVPFLLTSWLGFILLFASGLLSILPVTGDEICQARPWLFNYGFILVMGSIFLKTYHIHLIFNNVKLVVRQISTRYLIMSLGIMLSLMTVVMLVWHLLETAQLYRVSSARPYCTTGSWVPFHLIAGLELLLVISCLCVSYLIRRVNQDYNESKCVAIIVYNTAFWGIAWWVVSSQESVSPPTLELLTSVFIAAVSFVNLFIFFFPKFYALSREDNKAFAITPRSGRSRLMDSAVRLSVIEASVGLKVGRLSGNVPELNIPENPKDALKQFREKLFETIRKWKANDSEHRRLKSQVRKCELTRDTDTQTINNWMNAIRVTLTSENLSVGDSDGLVEQMKSLARMDVDQLMEEAEKHEDSSRKRNAVAPLNSPKLSLSRPVGNFTPRHGMNSSIRNDEVELVVRTS